jgi:hypothetical protein
MREEVHPCSYLNTANSGPIIFDATGMTPLKKGLFCKIHHYMLWLNKSETAICSMQLFKNRVLSRESGMAMKKLMAYLPILSYPNLS